MQFHYLYNTSLIWSTNECMVYDHEVFMVHITQKDLKGYSKKSMMLFPSVVYMRIELVLFVAEEIIASAKTGRAICAFLD